VHEPPVECPPINPIICTGRIGADFLQATEIEVVPADFAVQDAEDLGTVFIFNDPIFNATNGIERINNSFATGSCTRTQNNETMGTGGGLCTFVYTLTYAAGNTAAFTATGEVFDFIGGLLPITGGAQEFIGANGELEILPFVGQFNTGGDLIGVLEQWSGDFWEADVYKVRAELETGDCL
jgi:hypothetical protein